MKRLIILGIILIGTGGFSFVGSAGAAEPHHSPTIAIPVSALDVEGAVATISVLHDPADSAHSLLGICESKVLRGIEVEGEDIQALFQKLCRAMKQLSREVSPPVQELGASSYQLLIPLRNPEQGIRAVTWTAKSLDDAFAFVGLLRSGNLNGLKVLTQVPWDPDSSQACIECPISDLVFNLKGLKEKGQFMK